MPAASAVKWRTPADEMAERESPAAHPLEPVVRVINAFLGEMDVFAVAMNQHEAEGAARNIANSDAAGAAAEVRQKRRHELQVPVYTR